jgi:regulator of protease activity HflC (stomatin/prohibitin superfamily)
MSRAVLTFLLVLFAIAAIVGYLSLFTVQQTQQALVLQFGNPIRVLNAPGGLTPAKEGAAEETGGLSLPKTISARSDGEVRPAQH